MQSSSVSSARDHVRLLNSTQSQDQLRAATALVSLPLTSEAWPIALEAIPRLVELFASVPCKAPEVRNQAYYALFHLCMVS